MAQISGELGIDVVTLYNWSKTWRLQVEVVPASEKDPEGWESNENTVLTFKEQKALERLRAQE